MANKTNKNKKRLGIAAMGLGLVLAVGATAGTTLAKYISSAKTEATATVAQWGYTITTTGEGLFSSQYHKGKIVKASNDKTIDVYATKEVVAPGASSEGADDTEGAFKITINGQAEVAAQLIIDISDFDTVWLNQEVANATWVEGDATKSDQKLGTGKYYPLQWSIIATADTEKYPDKQEAKIPLNYNNLSESTTMAQVLATAIKENIEYTKLPEGATVNTTESTGSKVVLDLKVGTVFSNYELAIAWEWPFTQEKDATSGTNHDVEDTVLGWLAYNKNKNQLEHSQIGTTETTTSNDSKKDVTVDLSKYTDSDYNLDVKVGFSVQIVQVKTSD